MLDQAGRTSSERQRDPHIENPQGLRASDEECQQCSGGYSCAHSIGAGCEVNLAVSGCQRLYRVSFMDFGTFSIQVCMVESILEGQFVLL